jgi:phage baseplate assembly protein W
MALPSVADRYSAQRPKNQALYSDFLTNFNVHPDSKQLMTVKDEVAVMRSIKSLLLTNKYERLFQPSLGSNLRNFLFEDISRQTQASIQNAIRETIRNHEPRANIIDVIATGYPDQNGYVVTIIFYLRSIENAVTLNIPLIRVR